MRAELLQRDRLNFDDGGIVEMMIGRVPKPVPGCTHPYKYRLFYGRAGKRIICYDNERPKGDHRLCDGREEQYEVKEVEKLVCAFLSDVKQRRPR